jgi:hypothetical protein
MGKWVVRVSLGGVLALNTSSKCQPGALPQLTGAFWLADVTRVNPCSFWRALNRPCDGSSCWGGERPGPDLRYKYLKPPT